MMYKIINTTTGPESLIPVHPESQRECDLRGSKLDPLTNTTIVQESIQVTINMLNTLPDDIKKLLILMSSSQNYGTPMPTLTKYSPDSMPVTGKSKSYTIEWDWRTIIWTATYMRETWLMIHSADAELPKTVNTFYSHAHCTTCKELFIKLNLLSIRKMSTKLC